MIPVDPQPKSIELSRLDNPESFEPGFPGEGELERRMEIGATAASPAPEEEYTVNVKPKAKRVAHKKVGSAKREAEKKKRAQGLVDIGDDTGRGVKGKVRRKVRLKEAGVGGDPAKAAARKKWREANREKERLADAARKKAKRVEKKE
jgi:hypothetical protein